MFAAYKVTTFDEVPATLKDPNGLWVNDYGGYLSIGYDADKVPALNVRQGVNLKEETNWKTFVPPGAIVGRYFAQAINKDAPYPAAARLWQEYLYSDEGRNRWLKGNARPARETAMVKAGTIDQAAYIALPTVAGSPIILTPAQNDRAKAYLTANWAAAIG